MLKSQQQKFGKTTFHQDPLSTSASLPPAFDFPYLHTLYKCAILILIELTYHKICLQHHSCTVVDKSAAVNKHHRKVTFEFLHARGPCLIFSGQRWRGRFPVRHSCREKRRNVSKSNLERKRRESKENQS